MKIKDVLREITPPFFWKAGSKFWREISSGGMSKWEHGVEQPPEFYDEAFENADSWRSHYTESRYYPLWTIVADSVRRAGAQKILDIGCGPGQVASLLCDKGIPDYLGIDFSSARVQQARSVCPEYCFEVVDVFETNLIETHDYDCALVMEFLEHVKRDLEVIERIKPGTLVIATVPNFTATGHVRCFDSMDEVRARYERFFEALSVEEHLANTSGKKYYLFEGVR